MRVEKKVTIITGSATGIGKATARLFLQEGAKVIIADFDREKGKETENELSSSDHEVVFIKTDVRIASEVQEMVKETKEHFGRIDVLINNAGSARVLPVTELAEEDWDRIVDTNLKSVYLCCKYTLPEMMLAKSGCIINMASVLGMVGRARASAYNAAKAGVILLTKNMALDYAAYHIRVNAVCPGFVETEMVKKYIENSEDPEKTREELARLHPIGRMARPEEIAFVVLFLASDESSFITGSSLIIDGGYSSQ